MPNSLQRKQRKHCHNRRLQHRPRNSIMPKTKKRKLKILFLRHLIPICRGNEKLGWRTRPNSGFELEPLEIPPIQETGPYILRPPSPRTTSVEKQN